MKPPRLKPSIKLARLLWVGPLTVLVSTAAVLVMRLLAVKLLLPPPAFTPLGLDSVAVLSAMLITCAVLVFVLVSLFASRPARVFNGIAIAVLLLSFVPDLTVPSSHAPGANWPNALALIVLHVTAWAVCVTMLTKLTRSI
jgi:hypothetical protein